jgi:DNA-binding response OmpR family regulator
MSNHRVIVIAQDFNYFDPLHDFLSMHDIDYQSYDTFNNYIAEHDYRNHVLIANALDINLKFAMENNEGERFNRKLYNCTYIIAYEHSNCTETLKESLLSGADDYLSFPFDPELTCLKIAAQHRHMNFLETLYQNDQTAIVYKHLTIDPFSKQIFLKSKRLDLTHSEFNILYTLAKNPNDVFNMEYLFQMITGQKSLGDYNALMTHVSRLRKKMAQIDPTHHYILTVRNKGYKFNAHIAEYMR